MALFVPLDASYAQDPKVLDLESEWSELLFVRSLAYCKLHLTDGFVHRRALAQLAPCDADAAQLAADLVRTGLWIVTDRGWRVTAWLKRNPGSEEILTPSKGRELAHRRHHLNKNILKEGCPLCFPAENPQVTTHDAVRGCDADAMRDAQHAMPESETEPESPTYISGQPQVLERDLNRAVGLYARLVAGARPGVANPSGYAASIGRNLDPHVRDQLAERLALGDTPEDAAAKVAGTTQPDGRRLRAVTDEPPCPTCDGVGLTYDPGTNVARRCGCQAKGESA